MFEDRPLSLLLATALLGLWGRLLFWLDRNIAKLGLRLGLRLFKRFRVALVLQDSLLRFGGLCLGSSLWLGGGLSFGSSLLLDRGGLFFLSLRRWFSSLGFLASGGGLFWCYGFVVRIFSLLDLLGSASSLLGSRSFFLLVLGVVLFDLLGFTSCLLWRGCFVFIVGKLCLLSTATFLGSWLGLFFTIVFALAVLYDRQ